MAKQVKSCGSIHKDMCGDLISDGDIVILAENRGPIFGKIEYSTPKMVRVKKLGKKGYRSGVLRYGNEVIKTEESKVTLYLLQNA